MSCINLIKYFINKLKTIRIHAVLVKWCVISLYQFCKWWLLFGLVMHLSFSYSFNHTFVYPTRAIIVLLSRSCLNYCSPTFACKKQKHHVLAFQSITYSLMPAHTPSQRASHFHPWRFCTSINSPALVLSCSSSGQQSCWLK